MDNEIFGNFCSIKLMKKDVNKNGCKTKLKNMDIEWMQK